MAATRKQKIVAFLGAGVSRGLGIPLMAEFTDMLRDAGHLHPDEQGEFDHIVAECERMASIIDGTTRNLEYLASFLDTLDRVQPGFTFASNKQYKTPKEARDFVLRCIWLMTSKRLANPIQMREFLGIVEQGEFELAIITTNYDLHVECATALTQMVNRNQLPSLVNDIQQLQKEILARQRNDDGMLATLTKRAEDYKTGFPRLNPGATVLKRTHNSGQTIFADDATAIPFFKLHGSVNWIEQTPPKNADGKQSEPNYWVDAVVAQEQTTPGGVPTWGVRKSVWWDTNHAMIVPPSVLKPSFQDEMFLEQWQGAAAQLQDADRIWFIGYSFPATDTFMRYFLAASLFKNTKVRQIAIVDPSESVADRAAAIFDAPRHRDVFVAIQAKWEELRPSNLANDDIENAAAFTARSRFYSPQEILTRSLQKWVNRELRRR